MQGQLYVVDVYTSNIFRVSRTLRFLNMICFISVAIVHEYFVKLAYILIYEVYIMFTTYFYKVYVIFTTTYFWGCYIERWIARNYNL